MLLLAIVCWGLRFSGILRTAEWWNFGGLEDGIDSLYRNVDNKLPFYAARKSQKSEDLIYTASEAWNHSK
jgi:hypothetical protein